MYTPITVGCLPLVHSPHLHVNQKWFALHLVRIILLKEQDVSRRQKLGEKEIYVTDEIDNILLLKA